MLTRFATNELVFIDQRIGLAEGDAVIMSSSGTVQPWTFPTDVQTAAPAQQLNWSSLNEAQQLDWLVTQLLNPARHPDLQTEAGRHRLILLGTGQHQVFPCNAVRRAWMARQYTVEVMDSAAACRTYSLLASDDRDVIAVVFLW